MPNEEYSLVLDYLAKGKSSSYKTEPLAQVLGEDIFTLLEVVPKDKLELLSKVYIGKDKRDKIDYIKKRISFNELTTTAQLELDRAIEKIVEENPKRFINFYNTSGPLTLKRHRLELLPGLGKKHVADILAERRKRLFESYEDISKRVHLMPDPKNVIVRRITEELENEDLKYYLFARPPQKPQLQQRGYGSKFTRSR